MDSDKKTHRFCKAELRKRFRLVFYLGKLSLAAYSEQFGKPGRNPTGPAHASRLVFTDHNRPPTAAMRPLLATTRQSSAMAKSGSSGKASFPCRMLETHRLAYPPPREYRFRSQSGTGHPRARSSTLQTIRPSDHFSKGDIILMASRMSYRSFIWSTRLFDSVESTPFPLTPFTSPSGGLPHRASWPLRTRRG